MSASGGGGSAKSKITLYILCHGTDMPDLPIVTDPSVRILSQAGKFGCWGFHNNLYFYIVQLIQKYKDENKSESTYSMLEHIKSQCKTMSATLINSETIKQNISDVDKEQFETTGAKSINFRQFRHTQKTRDANEDWQIYTPVCYHLYDFSDKIKWNRGIDILDIINKPTRCEFKTGDNLFEIINSKKMDKLKKMPMIDFFSKHPELNLDDPEKITELDAIGCENMDDFMFGSSDPKSLIKILGAPAFDSINKIIREHEDKIMLSELIQFLKDERFDIINIVDKSCRSYGGIMSKKEFAKINAEESVASELIDRTLGGNSKQRKKRRKSTRKKRRISKRRK